MATQHLADLLLLASAFAFSFSLASSLAAGALVVNSIVSKFDAWGLVLGLITLAFWIGVGVLALVMGVPLLRDRASGRPAAKGAAATEDDEASGLLGDARRR
jgi:hypothetical protein